MNKIAVDVVLLLPNELSELTIKINKSFPNTAKEDYILDSITCIPHITLLMGLMLKDHLSEIRDGLNKIAGTFSSLNLRITGFNTSVRPDGKKLSTLVVEKTPELQNLHEVVLGAMNHFFNYEGVQKEMFYAPPTLNEIPLFWVKGFAKTSVRENYEPHITLGVGEPQQLSVPIQFTASKIALCHLGNYCTCRDILWSATLT